jgi:DNA-binding transcriptional LysR family regulator
VLFKPPSAPVVKGELKAVPPVLDIPALRSLTTIVDAGGFHRAADILHMSQSGVSQHVRKLERTVGHRLFERRGRDTLLTADGEALVADARRILAAHDETIGRLGLLAGAETPIAIGSTEHAADHILGAVTEALSIRFPAAGFRVRLDRSGRLNEAVDRGTIDVVIFVGDADDPDRLPAGALPLSWYAAPGWQRPADDAPVPLIAIDGPCTIRRRALQTLADHDLSSDVVAEAAHVGGVVHAARAGLGVALLADIVTAPEGLERRYDLPAVSPEALHVRVRRGADPDLGPQTAAAVAALVAPDELLHPWAGLSLA